jgi:hypothetical protein
LGDIVTRLGCRVGEDAPGALAEVLAWRYDAAWRDPSPATHRSCHPAGPRRHPASVQRVLECYHRIQTQNTIDESVWETLSRDLVAVWEKMRQVLWPKYLLVRPASNESSNVTTESRHTTLFSISSATASTLHHTLGSLVSHPTLGELRIKSNTGLILGVRLSFAWSWAENTRENH